MMHKLLCWVVPFVTATWVGLAGCAVEEQARTEYKGYTVKDWAATLKASDVESRQVAAAMLSEMGSDARGALPELIEALGDEDPLVRRLAVQSLGNIGPEAHDAADLIAEKVTDGHGALQREGVRALAKITRQATDSKKPAG